MGQYKFKCVFENRETVETLRVIDRQDEYFLSLAVDGNKLIFCEEKEGNNAISFMQDWFKKSEENIKYPITYLGTEYSLSAPAIFGIIINEFKKKIDKKYIIDSVNVQFYIKKNKIVNNGMNAIFKALGIQNNDLEFLEEENFDYSEDMKIMKEILEKKKIYEGYQKMFSRAIVLAASDEEKEQLEQSRNIVVSDESFAKEVKKYTTKQRAQLKLCRLDNNSMFYASKFFEKFNDHKNLVFVSKKFNGIMERFRFNPVSVDEKTISFFPNTEIFHTYEQKDRYLEKENNEQYKQYIDWAKRGWLESQDTQKERNIVFKKIIFTKSDFFGELEQTKVEIPSGVEEMEGKVFGMEHIKQIEIPNTVTYIANDCFEGCGGLTSLSLPLDQTRVLYGNKLFNNLPHFAQSIYLPNVVFVINGNQVKSLTELTIPSFVTSFDDNCFLDCINIKKITIPEKLTNFKYNLFMKLAQLEEITLCQEYQFNGDRLFRIVDGSLTSVMLPSTIKKVNGKSVQWKPLAKYEIPKKLTKIGDYCFAHCDQLAKLGKTKQIKEIGKGSFIGCSKLKMNKFPFTEDDLWYAQYEINAKDKQQLERWTKLKFSEVVFDTNNDNWAKDQTQISERIMGRKDLVFLIEDTDGERFGYYLNVEIEKQFKSFRSNEKTFEFNLESHGRLKTPMKFEIRDPKYGYQLFNKNNDYFLITLGDIEIHKEACKHMSRCYQEDAKFNYKNCENALCGKSIYKDEKKRPCGKCFTPERIVIIQLKVEEVGKKKKK